jgi:hypothetical protein
VADLGLREARDKRVSKARVTVEGFDNARDMKEASLDLSLGSRASLFVLRRTRPARTSFSQRSKRPFIFSQRSMSDFNSVINVAVLSCLSGLILSNYPHDAPWLNYLSVPASDLKSKVRNISLISGRLLCPEQCCQTLRSDPRLQSLSIRLYVYRPVYHPRIVYYRAHCQGATRC